MDAQVQKLCCAGNITASDSFGSVLMSKELLRSPKLTL
jgi:hypothetical protein